VRSRREGEARRCEVCWGSMTGRGHFVGALLVVYIDGGVGVTSISYRSSAYAPKLKRIASFLLSLTEFRLIVTRNRMEGKRPEGNPPSNAKALAKAKARADAQALGQSHSNASTPSLQSTLSSTSPTLVNGRRNPKPRDPKDWEAALATLSSRYGMGGGDFFPVKLEPSNKLPVFQRERSRQANAEGSTSTTANSDACTSTSTSSRVESSQFLTSDALSVESSEAGGSNSVSEGGVNKKRSFLQLLQREWYFFPAALRTVEDND